MSRQTFYERVDTELNQLQQDGLYKAERPITTPQGAVVGVIDQPEVRNFCANNYLGLANHPDVITAATDAMNHEGYGMASVRFICGTTLSHQRLERVIADYVGTDDSITFAACFDANGAVFEPLLGAADAIVSDSLNHASIIDGIRLCKARRYRFESRDLTDLRTKLIEASEAGAETILIVTDGVFSMDGFIADLAGICELADQYDALIMVDDCHATGVIGPSGRGTAALHEVTSRVDIVTSTLGKALGGAMGGFVAARQPIVDLLRQRARPYLFSNALSPSMVGGALAALNIAHDGDTLRERLTANAAKFRSALTKAGFELTGSGHPIIPIIVGDAHKANDMATRLEQLGVFVTAFFYPVVPHGAARIRTQMSAAHSTADIDVAIEAFIKAGTELGIVRKNL